MPKTEAEKRTLTEFTREYGGDKGKQVYFALRNKNKKFDRSQGGGMSSGKKKKAKSEWWGERLAALPKVCRDIVLDTLLKAEHEGHLVTDDKGNKHLPTHSNGKPNHRLMGAAWAALHGGYRGNKYEGPDKSSAIAKLKKLYHSQGLTPPSEK